MVNSATSGNRTLSIAEALARAGWDAVADRLMSGLTHDLNGRIASLHGLVQLARMTAESDLDIHVEEEARKLEDIVALFGLLAGTPGTEPEPMALGEHLPQLISLHSLDRSLHRIDTILDEAEQAPPILVNWCVFTRAFLILANQVGASAREHGAGSVRIAYGPANDGLLLTISVEQPDADGANPSTDTSVSLTGTWQATHEGVSDALVCSGATPAAENVVSGDLAFEIWFPTLATQRQQQAS